MIDRVVTPPKTHAMDGYQIIQNGYTATSSIKPPAPSGGSSAVRPPVFKQGSSSDTVSIKK